jgi:hypothetical protein
MSSPSAILVVDVSKPSGDRSLMNRLKDRFRSNQTVPVTYRGLIVGAGENQASHQRLWDSAFKASEELENSLQGSILSQSFAKRSAQVRNRLSQAGGWTSSRNIEDARDKEEYRDVFVVEQENEGDLEDMKMTLKDCGRNYSLVTETRGDL